MTLYEIDARIGECIDVETGEILDYEKLDGLQMERETENRKHRLFNREHGARHRGLERAGRDIQGASASIGEKAGKAERVSLVCVARTEV